MVLQLLHRGAPLSRYLSNAHHVHGMCGCCALTQLRSPRRWSRRAKTHGLLVRRHGIFNRLRCAPDQRPTRERAANQGSGHGHSVARRGRACSCSPLTAAQCSFRCSSAPVARPPSPPPSRPRWRAAPRPSASLFSTIPSSSRCFCCCCRSLRGGLELQGGGCGGCGGAAVRRLAPNGSGAHLWRLWRRCVGALAALASLPRLLSVLKKSCASTAFFSHWRVHVR